MGKKRVIKKTADELINENEKISQKVKKEVQVKAPEKMRRGRIYISSTYNNTLITLTDDRGNALVQRSAGSVGFKGTKKGTSYAGSQVAQVIAGVCDKLKIKEVDIYAKGVGGGRDSAVKTLANQGVEINSIKDTTPIPHNGCRPPRKRRT